MITLLGIIRNPQESKGFVHYIADLARDIYANVHLLYVENPIYYPLGTPDLSGVAMVQVQKNLERMVSEGKKNLEDEATGLMSHLAGEMDISVSAKVGNEMEIINEMVSSGKIHMIAIEYNELNDSKGKDVFARDVIRTINCPVWVIPDHSEYHSMKSIIYATDYHQEDISTLKKLIDLTHRMSPKINALHITDNVDFDLRVKNAGFQKILETKTEYTDISLKVLVEKSRDDLVKLIISYAAIHNADLIVVLKENKNFLDRILNPSPSEKIIQEADKPVLVYHATNES